MRICELGMHCDRLIISQGGLTLVCLHAIVCAAVQALSPELASVVAHPSTPPAVVATCFSIMAELAGALASLSGIYQRQVSQG
jgi:hypothetical protein